MSGYVPRNLRGGKTSGASERKPDRKSVKPRQKADEEESGTTKPRSTARPGTKKPRPSPRPTGGAAATRRPGGKKKRGGRLNLRRFRFRVPRVPSARTLAVRLVPVTLAVLVLTVGLWFAAGGPMQVPWASDPSTDARKAAVNAATAMFSYDYRTFDDSAANGKSYVTGDYAKEYDETIEGLRTNAEKEKAQVKAEVKDSAVVSEGGECSTSGGQTHSNTVEVLVFMDQLTKNANIDGTKQDSSRLVMCMVTAEDAWKAANVKVV